MSTDSKVIFVFDSVMKGLKRIHLVLGRRERLFYWMSSMLWLVDLYK